MYARNNPLEEFKSFFRQRSLLSRLIIINLIVFIFANLINLFFWLFQAKTGLEEESGISFIVYWFAVPSNVSELVLKPWTIFSYMFLHENLMHLLFNMVMLYFGGRIFVEYLNSKKLLSVYIWGGLFGAFLYVLAYNGFPVFQNAVYHSVALGASASVLAVLVAIATYVPNYIVPLILIGRVKLKYVAFFFIAISMFNIQGGNPGGNIAHIGGALSGFLYILLLKKGYSFDKFFKFPKISYRTKGPRKVYSNPKYSKRAETDDQFNRRKKKQQKEIDIILDKISKSGYSSLSQKEKEMLFKISNKK